MSELTQKTLKQCRSTLMMLALLVAALFWIQPMGTVQAAPSAASLNESAAGSVDGVVDAPTQAPEEFYCDLPILPNVTSTEHFQINYGNIRAPLTIDDFKAALEEAYQLLIVDYGWAEPPLCPGNLEDSETDLTGDACYDANPWGKYPVMIKPNLDSLGYVNDGDGEADFTGWVGDNPNTSAVETYAKASCMVLESNYKDQDEGTELDVLRGTVAHEYVHAIQMGVGDPPSGSDEDNFLLEEDGIWYESHATYIEQEIVDEGNTNHYLLYPGMGTVDLFKDENDEGSAETYHVCLGQYPEASGFHYTNWPFFQHIAENFGGTNVGDATNTGAMTGENINFRIFENIAQGQRGLTALENALGGQSMLQTEYHNYSIALALMYDGAEGCGDGYVKPYCLEEGAIMAAHDGDMSSPQPEPNGSIRGIPGTYNGEIADHYTANYIKLPASNDTMFDVQLSASNCGNVALRASLVCDSGSGSTITAFPEVVVAGQSTKLAQQALASCTSAYVVVTNEYDSREEANSCVACGYTLALEQNQDTDTPSPVPTATPTVTSTVTSTVTARLTQDQLDEFAQYVQDEMAENDIPGVAIAIVQGNEVVLSQGFGTKEVDNDDPVTNETLFHIGSTHKSMTAMMIATMVDEELLNWDSRAVDIDDEFTLSDAEATEQVTLRHLLSMQGGISADSEGELYEDDTPEDIFDLMEMESLLGLPGTEFEYSNISYALGGYLAAMADGEEFDDLYAGYARSLQKRVLDPIGMNNATIYASEALSSNHLSKSHKKQGDQNCAVTQSIDIDGDALAPSGSLKANIDDMARYMMTQVNRGVAPDGQQVVSSENLMTTWEPQGTDDYGLGWDRTTISAVDLVFHEGEHDSFLSVIGLMPALNTSFVILTNCGDGAEPLIKKAPERLITLLNQASVEPETPTEEPTVTPTEEPTVTPTEEPTVTPEPPDTDNVSDEVTKDDDVELATFAPSYVVAGQNIVYEIIFHNKGSRALRNIIVESRIPANTTYVGGGEHTGNRVNLTTGRVDAGASETLTYTVQVNEDLAIGETIRLGEPSLDDGYYSNDDRGALTTVEAEGEVVVLYKDQDGIAFDVMRDSFKFGNYGNVHNFRNDLTVADVFAFFGPRVCKSGNTAESCVLTGPARKWMRTEIKDADGGHCEGMAVATLRLFEGLDFKGKNWPEDYQSSAEDNADLTFPDEALENHIMYYISPQTFREVRKAVIVDSANNIVDKLIEGFQQEPPIAYTVGIFTMELEDGHTVTAYGIEKVTEKEYRILIYDNNYPRQKQYIAVDREANTWRYATSATPGQEPDEYRGTATSRNLDITPVSARDLPEGEYFTCPFCRRQNNVQASQNQTETHTIRFEYANEGAFLVVDNNNKMTGYDFNTETFVNEIPDASVTHHKGGLGKKIPPVIEIDYDISDIDEETSYDIFISGKTIVSPTNGLLNITGEGYALGLDYIELDPDELLEIKIYPDGTALDFAATETILAPQLYIAYDPVYAEEPSVIFEVDNVFLDADEYIYLDFDPDTEWFTLYDSGGFGQEFDLVMILIWPDGEEEVFTQIITMPEGTHDVEVDFGAWDGLLDPPLYIDYVLQNSSINHRLEIVNTVSTFDSTAQENAQAGVVSIAATYQNNSEVSLENIYFDVVELGEENVLLNEGIQTSTRISVPTTLLGDDGILDPLESFTFTLKVGIASQTPFQFRVNAHGTPVEWLPGEEPLPASNDDVSGQAFALDVGANIFDEEAPTALTEIEEPLPIQLFLPLIKQ